MTSTRRPSVRVKWVDYLPWPGGRRPLNGWQALSPTAGGMAKPVRPVCFLVSFLPWKWERVPAAHPFPNTITLFSLDSSV